MIFFWTMNNLEYYFMFVSFLVNLFSTSFFFWYILRDDSHVKNAAQFNYQKLTNV